MLDTDANLVVSHGNLWKIIRVRTKSSFLNIFTGHSDFCC